MSVASIEDPKSIDQVVEKAAMREKDGCNIRSSIDCENLICANQDFLECPTAAFTDNILLRRTPMGLEGSVVNKSSRCTTLVVVVVGVVAVVVDVVVDVVAVVVDVSAGN